MSARDDVVKRLGAASLAYQKAQKAHDEHHKPPLSAGMLGETELRLMEAQRDYRDARDAAYTFVEGGSK